MRILGMMSGTSADGIDAALLDFTITGTNLAASVCASELRAYPSELREAILRAQDPSRTTANDIAELHARIGNAHADFARDILAVASADAICLHGQTLNHLVREGRTIASLQVGDAARVAAATGLPVIHNVRANDIALGGAGAPFAPLLDVMLAQHLAPVALVNIGGLANLTAITSAGVTAFDTGPGNCLIDAYLSDSSGGQLSYDDGGALAARGTVHEDALAELLADPYFAAAPPKSTGREYFTLQWAEAALARAGLTVAGSAPDPDIVATFTALTARTIAEACLAAGATRTYIAGGGAHNASLLAALGAAGLDIRPMAELGISADLKEAVLMAVLGFAALAGLPATVTDTGATRPAVPGAIALPPTAPAGALAALLSAPPPVFAAAWPTPLILTHRKDPS
ncbi:anhydro-N-acetylmuramic acid kinase [Bowdeniella nasicola]|uniref:Anhydro-N-acetylmuramic acid kinase n=2 Tax=Bowdeniella nasicola TaxID=208480 RepID=A0A1H4AAE7_9ACTO|nr:anhydro-N-acetylmuramic acid kinase [Bowdeniella nasicola]